MVHLLVVDDVTVLFLAQVGGVDAVGSQELSVGHAEGLTDGLSNELCLWGRGEFGQRGYYSSQMTAASQCFSDKDLKQNKRGKPRTTNVSAVQQQTLTSSDSKT